MSHTHTHKTKTYNYNKNQIYWIRMVHRKDDECEWVNGTKIFFFISTSLEFSISLWKIFLMKIVLAHCCRTLLIFFFGKKNIVWVCVLAMGVKKLYGTGLLKALWSSIADFWWGGIVKKAFVKMIGTENEVKQIFCSLFFCYDIVLVIHFVYIFYLCINASNIINIFPIFIFFFFFFVCVSSS